MAVAGQLARYDNLRSLGFASISGVYAGVGPTFTHPVRILTIDNFTDANLIISFNGVNDMTVIHSMSSKVIDYASNKILPIGLLEQPAGDRVYIREESGAPTLGNFYVTVVWAATV